MKLIQEYTPVWARTFQEISIVLHKAIIGQRIQIEHVGSTSVVGLAAKPIIDIDVIFGEETDLETIKSQLVSIGYFHNGNQGIPMREAFKRVVPNTEHPVLDNIHHHLYVCPSNSPELKRHLLFRDYLRQNIDAREEYTAIKQAIAREANQDKSKYAEIKEVRAKTFIESIIAKAEKISLPK